MKRVVRAAAVASVTAVVAAPVSVGSGPIASAHAEGFFKNLVARLRGETLPGGIVRSNGRIEATQVDLSSKYAGRLAEVAVEEGSTVTQGQVIARVLA